MLGGHPGWTPNPAEAMAPRLSRSIEVRLVSSSINPLMRVTATVFHLLRCKKSMSCAVVMVYGGRSFRIAELSSRLARASRVPTISWLHGGSLPNLARTAPRRVRALLHRSATCIAPSKFLAHALERLGVEIEVIPNLVDLDLDRFRLRSKPRPRILWMRKFQDIYQPIVALEAFNRVRTRFPQARMTMTGQDRGMLDTTMRHAAVLGCESHVDFAGFLSGVAKQAAFSNHDIFLHTNSIDNAPVTLVEAAAYGLPIVASKVGGVPDLLASEIEALMVAPDQPQAAASAIIRLVEEQGLAERLSVRAFDVAQAASWPNIAPKWQKIFASATGRDIPNLN